jgi:hypothetical protein
MSDYIGKIVTVTELHVYHRFQMLYESHIEVRQLN